MVNPFCARTQDYPHTLHRRHRVKFTQRERATYLKLARLGQPTQNIAHLFHRSRSVIQRVLKNHPLPDLRKIPRAIRERAAQIQRSRLIREGERWLLWSLGEGEKPP